MDTTVSAPLNNHPDEAHHLVSLRWDCRAFMQVSVEMSGESQSEAAASGEPGYQWAHPSLGRSPQATWTFLSAWEC